MRRHLGDGIAEPTIYARLARALGDVKYEESHEVGLERAADIAGVGRDVFSLGVEVYHELRLTLNRRRYRRLGMGRGVSRHSLDHAPAVLFEVSGTFA